MRVLNRQLISAAVSDSSILGLEASSSGVWAKKTVAHHDRR
jgi:hypothetical protein